MQNATAMVSFTLHHRYRNCEAQFVLQLFSFSLWEGSLLGSEFGQGVVAETVVSCVLSLGMLMGVAVVLMLCSFQVVCCVCVCPECKQIILSWQF